MSSISSVGGAGSAWPDPGASRAARMFAKTDTDGNGSIDKTELQSMLDRISSKTGRSLGSADTLMTKMDSNGDGSLSSDELAAGMKSLLPQPASTVDFAEQHGHHGGGSVDALFKSLDTNGSGGLDAGELNKLLDQVAGGAATGSSDGTSTSGTTTDASAVSTAADAAIFKRLDTDGDGAISKAELGAAISGAGPAEAPEGAPPAPPADGSAGKAATSAASGASGTTTYDPLDTNHDGVVSAQERLAGDVQQLVKAMDSNGDGSISASEVDSFINQLTAAQGSGAPDASASSSADSGADTSGQTAKAAHHGGHHHGQGSVGALGDMVREEYTRAAANYASTDTVNVSA